MGKQQLFMSEGDNTDSPPLSTWNSSKFGMEVQANDLNSTFSNPTWENSLDKGDPFESALSSIVSSPVASNTNAFGGVTASGGGDAVMIELIGRLGNICNSCEILPQPYINNDSSTKTSCHSTPLNPPPKLNISMMDSQIKRNLPILGNNNSIVNHPSLAPFPADPGFAERAARFSCFGKGNLASLIAQFGLNEPELPDRLLPGKLARVSSNQSMMVTGSQVSGQESNKSSPVGNSVPDKKFNGISRPSTLECGGDSREESSVSKQIQGGELKIKGQNDANARKRKLGPRGKAYASDAMVEAERDESNVKRSKSDERKWNEKDALKGKAERKQSKDNSKPPEPPKDYIHVRARRGQATDSHSLAERVRRERISERMKFLQDLVPGCNKVIGKAVMLDEIINYVQSLQRQVEFLSMKLATVNPRMNYNMQALLSKDIFQPCGSMQHSLHPFDSLAPAFPYGYQFQQGPPPLHNGMPTNAGSQISMNPSNNAMLQQNPIMHLPPLDGLDDVAQHVSTFCEDDLQNVVHMGLNQNQQQHFHGTKQKPKQFTDNDVPGNIAF